MFGRTRQQPIGLCVCLCAQHSIPSIPYKQPNLADSNPSSNRRQNCNENIAKYSITTMSTVQTHSFFKPQDITTLNTIDTIQLNPPPRHPWHNKRHDIVRFALQHLLSVFSARCCGRSDLQMVCWITNTVRGIKFLHVFCIRWNPGEFVTFYNVRVIKLIFPSDLSGDLCDIKK